MKHFFTILLAFSFITITLAQPASRPQIKNPGLRFTENKGQVRGFDGTAHPEVKFVTGDKHLKVFLLPEGIAYQFVKAHRIESPQPAHYSIEKRKESKENRVETFRMDMQLAGANKHALVTTAGRSIDYEQHYNRDALDVHHYQTITYHDIYPGIDWVLHAGTQHIKYDFVVRPGADPSQIRIRFLHHESISLDKEGDLSVGNTMGTITEQAPVSYQGNRQVGTKFILSGDELVFSVADYNRSQTLVIDPKIEWGSFFGGSGNEEGFSCASDAFDNIFLAGSTESTNNIAYGGHQVNLAGGLDAFLAKFNGTGVLEWATYYGGSGDDEGRGCATDAAGNVFLSGMCESASGIASGGHQNAYGGNSDVFLVKFNTIGTRQWATYYGGTAMEFYGTCATDPSGNIYLGGTTKSTANIATSGAFQLVLYGSGYFDGFLAKFNTNGVRQWGTYYGGSKDDYGFACATDAQGNVFLAGETSSTFNIESSGHQSSNGGYADAFIVKFSSAGSRTWGTYYGGQLSDVGLGCATDQSGNVYLAGFTGSGNNISTPGSYQSVYSGTGDNFLVKFSAAGIRSWGTYAGAGFFDQRISCETDATGNVFVGRNNLMKFASSGSHQWTYTDLQASISDCARAGSGEMIVAGTIAGPNSVISGGHQAFHGGGSDAFIVLLGTCNSPAIPGAIAGPTMICGSASVVMTYSVPNDPSVLSYSWSFQGSGWTGNSNTNIITVTAPGGGLIQVAATGTCGSSENSWLFVPSTDPPQISVSSAPGVFCTGMSVPLKANGADTYTWTWGPIHDTYTVSPLFPTTYTVSGTANTGCTNTATYFLHPDTTTVFNFTVNGMNANFSIRNPACSSFEWEYGNGSGSTINPNPVVTYQNAGTYGVCLKCNGLPLACVRCININVPGNLIGGVGITETQPGFLIDVFPNPAQDKFTVVLPASCRITLVNSLGQIVMVRDLPKGENLVDISTQPSGVYYLKVEHDSGTRSFRVVRQ